MAIAAITTVRKIPHLRWWIAGLLFLSTVINYVDRQTLSVLARTIQNDLGMGDMDYTRVVQAFLLAYTVTYIFAGRITDWLGTRVSLAVFITWWSTANMLTALARSTFSLGCFRALLGIGEPGNYTAAPKAVSEWFPSKERGLVVGIYTAGATLGATIAPPLIAYLVKRYDWRSAFVFTGSLGLVWVIPWLWLYRLPKGHPRITAEELRLLESSTPPEASERTNEGEWQRWRVLLRRKEAWLLMISRVLTDPVWYFYLFWFPKYLGDARQLSLLEVGKVAWVVYVAADIGCVAGGRLSDQLIRRGIQPLTGRVRVMTVAACLLPLSPLIAFTPSLTVVLAVAAIAAFAHMTWQVTMGALIVDLFPSRSVATVFGLIAAGSGLGGLLSTEVVGRLVTYYSYTPVFVLMGLLHPVALILVRWVKR